MQAIQTPLIPYDRYESYESLEGLSPDAQLVKLMQLIKEFNQFQRNTFKLCLEFLSERIAQEPDPSQAVTHILQSIFRPQ